MGTEWHDSKRNEALYGCVGLSQIAEELNQSVFNFVAIPQGMVIATLELHFTNSEMLRRISNFARPMLLRFVVLSFSTRDELRLRVAHNALNEHSRSHAHLPGVYSEDYAKAVPEDPYYLQICVTLHSTRESVFFRKGSTKI